jgi:hypothetical protein
MKTTIIDLLSHANSPLQLGIVDNKDILRQRLNEYREYLDMPHKMIGKFPVEIFRRWYDQYN